MKVDIEQNKEYYLSDESLPCDCNYCKNFYNLIKITYPQICSYLEELGVDVLRPLELSPVETDENNIIRYCVCQYLVFGFCEKDFHHQIGNVEFTFGTSYPTPKIKGKQDYFVIDCYPIFLPMQLPC